MRRDLIVQADCAGKEHLKLARVYYFERVGELRSSLFGGIEDFKCASRRSVRR